MYIVIHARASMHHFIDRYLEFYSDCPSSGPFRRLIRSDSRYIWLFHCMRSSLQKYPKILKKKLMTCKSWHFAIPSMWSHAFNVTFLERSEFDFGICQTIASFRIIICAHQNQIDIICMGSTFFNDRVHGSLSRKMRRTCSTRTCTSGSWITN